MFHGGGFVRKKYDDDASIMAVDSRMPDWVEKGTIPGGDGYSVGYPARKILWDRGGMQDWENPELTTVRPESE